MHVRINIQSEQRGNQSHQQPFQLGNYQQPNYYQQNYQQQNYQQLNYQLSQPLTTNSNWRNPKQTVQRKKIPKMGRNPLYKNGIETRCTICQSINHWSQNSPDNINTEYKVVLDQTDDDNTQELKHLMSETWDFSLTRLWWS